MTRPLHAIVLAAGRGRRMWPISRQRHKALLPIAGTTILERTLDSLAAVGVEETIVVTGFRADDVRNHITDRRPGTHVSWVHNPHYETTNNIVSLSLAFEGSSLEHDIFLVECDVLFETKALEALAARGHGNAALLAPYRPGMDGTVVSIEDGIVTAAFPPEAQAAGFSFEGRWKTLNVYRFDRHFCRTVLAPAVRFHADRVNPNSFYEVVLARLGDLRPHRIVAECVTNEQWAEVDDANDLSVARYLFEPERRAEILDRALGGTWNFPLTDFSFMRNVHFPTDPMVAALRHALPDLLASYGSRQEVLNEKLGWFLGCNPGRLQALHGASQVFPFLPEVVAGRSVAVPSPTFGEYARAFPGAVIYEDGPGIGLAAVEEAAFAVDVVVVVNPNNPTGTTLPTRTVHAIARRHPRTTFLVDESFVDFSGERPTVGLLEDDPLPNMVVLNSLSKTLGVPGLRLGYLYCADAAVVAAVGRRLPIWNLSAPAEAYLELLLKFRPQLADSIARTIGDRELFREQLAALDVVAEVYPSGANFLLVRLAGDPDVARRARRALLADAGIDVKDVTTRFPDRVPRLRVAVRDADDNRRFAEALANVTQAAVRPPMSRSWRAVWAGRQLSPSGGSKLAHLMAADGLDTEFGTPSENEWTQFVRAMATTLGIGPGDSVFDVGCGAGAFLYDLAHMGLRVGGIDLSSALVSCAGQVMPEGQFDVVEASDLDAVDQYDAVVSCAAFLYFPSLEYAERVLDRMVAKARRVVAVLDLPDAAAEAQALEHRIAAAGGDGAYTARYAGLKHLHFERLWIERALAQRGLVDVRVADQDVQGYGMGRFRFNAWGFTTAGS